MSTVNFSVPDDLKDAFNRTFEGQNKSAIVARLMRDAIAEAERKRRRQALFDELTAQREQTPPASLAEIVSARESGRE